MTSRRRPTARHGPAGTAQAALSSATTLDEAAAILADIEGSEALRHARSAAEHNQRRSCSLIPDPPLPYQSRRTHRRTHLPDTTPSLGIFWAVIDQHKRTHLVAYRCALANAESYGDCLTSPAGHYDTWAAWRRGQPKPPLALLAPIIAQDEYADWPRGRIVYERLPDRFVIYADRKLLTAAWLAQITAHFHLPPERTVARSDLHYRNTRAIGPP